MRKKTYARELNRLQTELVAAQDWVKATGQRIVILFEGRDAAGKGGVIELQAAGEVMGFAVVLPKRDESNAYDDAASMSGRRYVPEEF
jgi:hypothetical protein